MTSGYLTAHSETSMGLQPAFVVANLPHQMEIVLDGERLPATRAISCVIEPRIGDQVLVFLLEGQMAVIVSILETGAKDSSPRTMGFSDGLDLKVSGRPLSLRSEGGLAIESSEIRILGRRFSGHFSECEIGAGTLSVTGELLSLMGDKIRHIATSLERVAEWLHDRAHGSIREIETLDRHTSGESMIESDSSVSIQSKTMLVESQDLVKIDSDQIHLG